MAMFVRWATPFGTIVGAVAGLVVVVNINYQPEIAAYLGYRLFPEISFICAMPTAIVAQMGVGMIASIPRTGRRACETEGYD
jgi:hypothetical protein